MSAYRFCRTDDIGLLVDALNRCWSPYFPDEPPMTPAAFKRSIRDIQVWCSSCMVAFSGSDPIGVLIGAKRPSATLIHKIAVHPDHVRQGHGRHLLASLSSKLAILGPPRIAAEVPTTFDPACALFSASGYVEEAMLTDYLLPGNFVLRLDERAPASPRERSGASGPPRVSASRRAAEAEPPGCFLEESEDPPLGRYLIPVTVDDLAANGLLGDGDPQVCWERSVETLMARKSEIEGLAVASDERIEAYVLYLKPEVGPPSEIVSLRTFIEDSGLRLKRLLSRLSAEGTLPLRFSKVHPGEIPKESLEALGFRHAGGHLLYAARPRSQ
jgi:GNAT superfamily N-acetyltransferase